MDVTDRRVIQRTLFGKRIILLDDEYLLLGDEHGGRRL